MSRAMKAAASLSSFLDPLLRSENKTYDRVSLAITAYNNQFKLGIYYSSSAWHLIAD
jgi:hypothetical protein